MKLHESWRLQYRRDPYLENLSLNELHERVDDLLANAVTFNADGKFAPLFPPVSPTTIWMVRFAHALEEYARRGQAINVASFFQDESMFRGRCPNVKRAAEVWKGHEKQEIPYLLKFGTKQHMERLLKSGEVRISPASFYSDSSLNPAIQDSELEVDFRLRGARVWTKAGTEIPVIGDVEVTDKSPTDYHVWCTTHTYDYRLFDDFACDACVLIHDPVAFLRRLTEEFKKHVPTHDHAVDEVMYIDPALPPKDFRVQFTKHFRYAYQKEFRVVFRPRQVDSPLDYVNVKLGDVTDYCELLVL